jgi:hypothetical protein
VPECTWLLGGDAGDAGAAAATLTGTAEDLLLALWRRTGLERLTVEGDTDTARVTFALALTP